MAADFDQGGDQDLLFGAGLPFDPEPDLLAINDGSGVFSISNTPLGQLSSTLSFAVADFDGDGAPDVFAGNRGSNTLLLGRRDGTFVDASSGLPSDPVSKRTEDLAVADFDGDLDVYEANSESVSLGGAFLIYSDRVLWNDGSAGFTASSQHVTEDRSLGVEAADFDEDGDVDVVVSRGFDIRLSAPRETVLYVNDGQGAFRAGSFPLTRDGVVASGDVDGDGDVDVDVIGDAVVFSNLRRQVALRGNARFGRPFDIRVFGDPGAPVRLAASLGEGSFATDFGLLMVDPDQTVFLDAGTVGPNGVLRVSFEGFQPPAGTTVFWQALVVHPARLTNLEVTTFVAF